MEHLEAANTDQAYVKFCQKRYKKLAAEVENAKANARLKPDYELENHYTNLDKHYTGRATEWKLEPMEHPENDFVSDLLNGYLKDIQDRVRRGVEPHAKAIYVLRKPMTNDSIIEEINRIGESCVILARTAAEKARDLEILRKQKLCEKRCSKHI
jgi:hypothetical protein